MARIFITSDDSRTSIEVRRDEETDEAVGWCEEHQTWVTDRGHFEDTCEAIANHLDNEH